jgi:hypothetical protein
MGYIKLLSTMTTIITPSLSVKKKSALSLCIVFCDSKNKQRLIPHHSDDDVLRSDHLASGLFVYRLAFLCSLEV